MQKIVTDSCSGIGYPKNSWIYDPILDTFNKVQNTRIYISFFNGKSRKYLILDICYPIPIPTSKSSWISVPGQLFIFAYIFFLVPNFWFFRTWQKIVPLYSSLQAQFLAAFWPFNGWARYQPISGPIFGIDLNLFLGQVYLFIYRSIFCFDLSKRFP